MNVSGLIVNRYCGSGVETIAMAAGKIAAGMADCIVAGGTESMSLVPTVGWKTVPNYNLAQKHPDYYLGMGLTAEAVAQDYKITREDQDQFSYNSHQKAIKAIQEGKFKEQIVPITVEETYLDPATGKKKNALLRSRYRRRPPRRYLPGGAGQAAPGICRQRLGNGR